MSSLYTVGSAAASSAAGYASRAFKDLSAQKVEVVKEYDDTERKAKVYLYVRPIEMFPNTTKEELMHWKLVLEFEDGSIRTAEGVQEENESLQAYYSKESPCVSENGRYHYIGDVIISPKTLRELTNRNACNGRAYCPTMMNCQTWVIDLAKKLGHEIQNKIHKFKTLNKSNPGLAVLVSASKSLSGASKSLSGSSMARNKNQ